MRRLEAKPAAPVIERPRRIGKPRRLPSALTAVAVAAGAISLAGAAAAAPSGVRAAASPSGGSATGPGPGPSPCGIAPTPKAWQHIVWIVFENKDPADIINPAITPNIVRLANSCGKAAHYAGVTHPSLPNYIALTSGTTAGIRDDKKPAHHQLTQPSIFGQLGANYRVYAESMPAPCFTVNSAHLYAARHNPAVYYVKERAACERQVLPLTGSISLSARFTMIVPNLINDMHETKTTRHVTDQLKAGDAWLGKVMPQLLASPEYRSGTTAIFLVWDEGSGGDNNTPLLVVSPSTRPGTVSLKAANHYGLLRTTQELLGLHPLLGAAADRSTTSLAEEFGL